MSNLRVIDMLELKELLIRHFVGPEAPMLFAEGSMRNDAVSRFIEELVDLCGGKL